jgi:hypothetical protein
MTVTIRGWEFEIGLRRVRPLVGGNLDIRAELEAAYASILSTKRKKPARRKLGAK